MALVSVAAKDQEEGLEGGAKPLRTEVFGPHFAGLRASLKPPPPNLAPPPHPLVCSPQSLFRASEGWANQSLVG